MLYNGRTETEQCKIGEISKFTHGNYNIVFIYRYSCFKALTVTPEVPWYPEFLNDRRYKSSSTEAGVLVAIIGHGTTPPDGGTHYNWWRATRTH
ncbi:hypothetical protein AVEN_119640-1 [Araneus ventricosus]|uniref:Uncharacterized protein n=1 Tax=Araneus ventricosus TaxID=182803 RepID=A0A4Y2P9R6_ARAVE|nr:hypothetical protein AVEN_119640-1 [Araneus ventricosus]